MDESTAYDLISTMVASCSIPKLSSGEITDLLTWARRVDADGRPPSDPAWTGTWDITAAATEGWLRKAGKVAGSFDFGTDGQTFNRSQMHAMCLEMASYYRRGVAVSVLIGTEHGTGVDTDVVANVNDR